MSPAKRARLAFTLALALLLVGGIAVSITIQQLVSNAHWTAHSYEVKAALGDVNSSLSSIARARFGYVHSGDEAFLPQYESSKDEVRAELQQVRHLTRDNPSQQLICDRLEEAVSRRISLLDASVALQKSGHVDQGAQDRFTLDGVEASSDVANIVQQMQGEEQKLLGMRRAVFGDLFRGRSLLTVWNLRHLRLALLDSLSPAEDGTQEPGSNGEQHPPFERPSDESAG